MYFIMKAIVSYNLCFDLYNRDKDAKDSEERSQDDMGKISLLLQSGADCNIHEILKSELHDALIGVLLAFKGIKGTPIKRELAKPDCVTGYYPFMTAAKSSNRSLRNVRSNIY